MDETTLNQAFMLLEEIYNENRITYHEYSCIFDALALGEAYLTNKTEDCEK